MSSFSQENVFFLKMVYCILFVDILHKNGFIFYEMLLSKKQKIIDKNTKKLGISRAIYVSATYWLIFFLQGESRYEKDFYAWHHFIHGW